MHYWLFLPPARPELTIDARVIRRVVIRGYAKANFWPRKGRASSPGLTLARLTKVLLAKGLAKHN